jgi:hypothetical protein
MGSAQGEAGMGGDMKSFIIRNNDGKKYDVKLNDKGEAVAYFVETYPKGKRTTMRLVWSVERHGYKNGDIPAKLKEILNIRGVSEQIANVMEW